MPGSNWEATLKARRDGLVPGFGAYDRRQEAEAAQAAARPAVKKAPAKKAPARKAAAGKRS